MAGNDSPELSPDGIRSKIRTPIGSRSLREIATGKKTAVILFDDITRATPADDVAPLLIEELKAGGIKDENILFVCSLGGHGAATHPEVRMKLGDAIVNNYAWINHNCHDNFMELGKTSFGNNIKVNHYVMKADVKVSISSLKTHTEAGYSGGAKIILPGVSAIDSIFFMHTYIADGVIGPTWTLPTNPTVGTGKIRNNEFRLNIEEAARMAGLDFTVQLVINGRRNIIGVHAGDVVDAYREAVRDANAKYTTQLARNADIVIANGYPRSRHESGFSWFEKSLRPGGTGVIINQMPLARSIHYIAERLEYTGKSFWGNKTVKSPVEKAGKIIMLSQYAQYRDIASYRRDKVQLVSTWQDALKELEKRHGTSTNVAVYPYIGIQHGPVRLDI